MKNKIILVLLLILVLQPLSAQIQTRFNSYIHKTSNPEVNINFVSDSDFYRDEYGHSLYVGYGNLLVGAPNQSYLGLKKAGAIYFYKMQDNKPLLFNSERFVNPHNFALFEQEIENRESEAGDRFGYSLGIVQSKGFDKGGVYVFGAIGEDVSNEDNAGVIHTLKINNDSGDTFPERVFSQDSSSISGGLAQIPGNSEAGDFFGSSLATGDFNDDGVEDVAIGVPGEAVNGHGAAGAVNVIMGDRETLLQPIPEGLRVYNSQIWTQASFGIQGSADDNDAFGYALAAGDFNGDGVADLAIGVPEDDVNGENSAGSVNVIYGKKYGGFLNENGLDASGDQLWHQDSETNGVNIAGTAEENDNFGKTLVVGNFNGDKYDDLAIGVPGEKLRSTESFAGLVNIIYGSSDGLTAVGNRAITQDSKSVPGVPESGDQFGSALAAGDLNHNGYDDLVIGTPKETIVASGITYPNAGTVIVMNGGRSGIQSSVQEIRMDYLQTPGKLISDIRFGSALAVGDMDMDGKDDLAISANQFKPAGDNWVYKSSVTVLYQKDYDLIFENDYEK